MTKLPPNAQQLAEVLGRERTLYLIGKLPRCTVLERRKLRPGKESDPAGKPYRKRESSAGTVRVIMYVPKALKPDHRLVSILGWNDAQRLVAAFGGEIICPPTLTGVIYRPFRDAGIVELFRKGAPVKMLCEWFEMTETRIQQLLVAAGAKTPQEAPKAGNDNHRRLAKQTSARKK